LADSPTPSTTRGRWPWDRSCAWGSFYAAQALYFAEDTPYHQALPAALGFLVRHLGHADPDHIRTWVYHGHNTVKELLMASATGVAMDTAPLKALLDWLKGYYRPDEGMFRTQAQPISNFTRHIAAIQETYEAERGADYWKTVAKASPGLLRHHLYHLVEDDWLTYTATRIALNVVIDSTAARARPDRAFHRQP
jgi:hypothetical protein